MNTMTAQDEALDLRRRLRGAGIPVGGQGNLETLRRVARAHGLGTRMAMDRAPAGLAPHLTLSAMYGNLLRRLDSDVFAVPVGEAARERGRGRSRSASDRMALDSRANASGPYSIKATYGDLFERLR